MFDEIFGHSSARPRVKIIAEAGVNHNGDLDMAVALLEEAARIGADAIKFQAFIPEEMILPGTGKAAYQRGENSRDEDQYQMLKRLQLPEAGIAVLRQKAAEAGIFFLMSVFDERSAAQLQQAGLSAFKIPSGELTNLPLIAQVASYGKPLILSTGMALLGEIEAAVDAALAAGNRQIVLFHCVSSYPAAYAGLNLAVIGTLKTAFHLPVGYSDHSEGSEAAIAAIALGALMVEKHFTLDKELAGPDHRASLDPAEFKRLVESIRNVEAALGDGHRVLTETEKELRALTRKSIVAKTQIEPQTIITRDMLALKRPGSGVAPKYLPRFIGARAARRIPQDAPLRWSDLENDRDAEE